MSGKSPTPLTKHDLTKIVKWFDQKVAQKECPCCDESAMVIWPYLACLPLLGQTGSSGQRFAVVSECRTCGHLRSFSAEKIGLVARTVTVLDRIAKQVH